MAVLTNFDLDIITESFGSGVRVDRDAGVIRGVKVIGFTSKNGRDYTPEALKGAINLYESAKVNIDHPEKSAAQPRSYGSRFGVLRNVRFIESQGVYADLHYNPKHALADQVCWDAENSPESFGLSHNAKVMSRKSKGRDVVERIIDVRSVDVVADPATTNSLFESHQPETDPEDEMSQIAEAINKLADATEADMEMMAMDAKKKIMKLKSMGVQDFDPQSSTSQPLSNVDSTNYEQCIADAPPKQIWVWKGQAERVSHQIPPIGKIQIGGKDAQVIGSPMVMTRQVGVLFCEPVYEVVWNIGLIVTDSPASVPPEETDPTRITGEYDPELGP